MSTVDVIIPCYRYGHFVRECVESVLNQSGVHVRVLIIDDASPDNTAEEATGLTRADSRVQSLHHTRNKGHIATYNEGIDWVRADYLLLLSADDYLLPGALSRAAALMDEHREISFTFGNALQLDATGMTSPITVVPEGAAYRVWTGQQFIESAGVGNVVPSPTAVVRTELQRQVGGYRAELPHSGDMEMWLRLAAHGSVGMVKAYQAVYRRHTSNMSLAYMADGFLPDVRQRKVAIDCFLQSCRNVLSTPDRLHKRLYRKLACAALGLAGAALDEGKGELSNELSRFALELYPMARWSLSSTKLAYKRGVRHRVQRLFRNFSSDPRLSN